MNSKMFLKLSFSPVFLCIGLETGPKCGHFKTCDMSISFLLHRSIERKPSHCICSSKSKFLLKRIVTEN